jgi:cytochrome c-type biogenesis protein CcmH
MRPRTIGMLLLLCALAVYAQLVSAQPAGEVSVDGKLQVPDAQQFVGAPKGPPLTGDALTDETHRIGSLLRCPVCQGMAVSDSPSEMAVNMKHQVRELVARGFTEEQILKYFELSYGQFVLLKPKFEGITGMVWILPILALALGGVVIFFTLKRLGKDPQPATAVAAADVAPSSSAPAEEDPYLARVRDLVSGDRK